MTLPRAARSGLLVSALVRRGTDVLMVREEAGTADGTSWVLPGGQVEPGELVHQAVMRELAEETGLRASVPGRLAFVCQYTVTHDPDWAGVWTVFTFEVEAPAQDLAPADPDGLVLEAAWVPLHEACLRLSRQSFRPRREALLHHLRDGTTPGRLWLWPDGTGGAPVVVPGP
ncbi:NUDIX hydrolase [Actinoallomurus bryophytorum]|uniref:8-oxo-dGTP diphosphatase n=1 Tax=Actinoallomurus bryophytorum TaxID=1490222 RepID=A0A543CN93_9ACTN|nr:NUDIX hydrolase [Actinoallomurus bryophytorum]TQL98430.1 8-oxo-dGTP diphosphatase [Actinoallomurus bryophytorum]